MEFDELAIEQGGRRVRASGWLRDVDVSAEAVVALATSDAGTQVGLGKVTQPDVDAFLTCVGIVPVMFKLIKGIV